MFKIPSFIKCLISSIFSAVIDTIIFQGFIFILPESGIRITLATIIARTISTAVNYTINKYWAFKSAKGSAREIILFLIMFLGKMALSALGVSLLCATSLNTVTSEMLNSMNVTKLTSETVIKLFIDAIIFVIGYFIQKYFIFVNKETSIQEEESTEPIEN